VDGEFLYALGAGGDLVCLETQTGKKHWHINLRNDLDGRMMSGWGYSESPLVDGEKLVCSPGGAEGTLAALDKKTGKVIWRSKDVTENASYSSIIVAEVGGVRQYIQMTDKGVIGVAAKDGKLLWQSELGSNGTAVIPTPIFHNDSVFVTADYGASCGLVKLSASGDGGIKAEEAYANKNLINHCGGVVLVDGYLYGSSGNCNGRPTKWVCMEFTTGKVAWQENRKLGSGSLTYADGRLYLYGQDEGTTVLLEPSAEGWNEHGRFTIPRQTTQRSPSGKIWTHPVVANGKLYLRDQDLLFCYDVKNHTGGQAERNSK
jgi:outer membrane protein assembly factor BamB